METRSAHKVRSKKFFFIASLINKQQRITGNKKSRTAVRASAAMFSRFDLPIEAQTKLNQPGIGIRVSGDGAYSLRRRECPRRRDLEVDIGQIEVGVVEHIEEVGTELKLLVFSYREAFLQGEIKIG